jgi:hypothetical protein
MIAVTQSRLWQMSYAAVDAAQEATSRVQYPDNYVDSAVKEAAYAQGVADVLRYLSGDDATPTESLAELLPSTLEETVPA